MIYLFNPDKHAKEGNCFFPSFLSNFVCIHGIFQRPWTQGGSLWIEATSWKINEYHSLLSPVVASFISGRDGGEGVKQRDADLFFSPSDITPASASPTQPISQSVHTESSVTGQAEEPEGEGGEEEECKCVTAPRPSGSEQEATCAYSAAFPAARRRYRKKKNHVNKLLTESASKERRALCMRIPHWLRLCWLATPEKPRPGKLELRDALSAQQHPRSGSLFTRPPRGFLNLSQTQV